jgi:hypothetical protein
MSVYICGYGISEETHKTHNNEAKTRMAIDWCKRNGKNIADVPIHFISRGERSDISSNVKIPPPQDNIKAPFLVVCYRKIQRKDTPYEVTLLGYCGKYKPGLRIEDLKKDLETAKEESLNMETVEEPTIQSLTVTLPEFFVFSKRPPMPKEPKRTADLWKDFNTFWWWFKEYASHAEIIPCPLGPDRTPLDVVFYLILMVASDNQTYMNFFVGLYGSYIKTHIRGCLPSTQQRLLFAKNFGLTISGPEEVEQKLISLVNIEAGRIRDAREIWEPLMPPRVKKLNQLVMQWFPYHKKPKV